MIGSLPICFILSPEKKESCQFRIRKASLSLHIFFIMFLFHVHFFYTFNIKITHRIIGFLSSSTEYIYFSKKKNFQCHRLTSVVSVASCDDFGFTCFHKPKSKFHLRTTQCQLIVFLSSSFLYYLR